MIGSENRVNLGRLREELRCALHSYHKGGGLVQRSDLKEIVDDVGRLTLAPDEASGMSGEAGNIA